mgnify:CR=1 FL=1
MFTSSKVYTLLASYKNDLNVHILENTQRDQGDNLENWHSGKKIKNILKVLNDIND